MTFSKLIKKKMFFLVFLLQIITSYFSNYENGINKTIGWLWNITNWIFYTNAICWFVFPIIYGILAILKYSTHKHLSLLHLLIISLIFIFDFFLEANSLLIFVLTIISILIFITNIIWAVQNRNKQ